MFLSGEKYTGLPIEDRAELIWNEGKFIEAIETSEYDISLYALGEFFVEVYYSVVNCRIEEIGVLSNEDRLKLYFRPEQKKRLAS